MFQRWRAWRAAKRAEREHQQAEQERNAHIADLIYYAARMQSARYERERRIHEAVDEALRYRR